MPCLSLGTAALRQAAHADAERIDVDGLPHVGAVVYPDQAYYSALDRVTGAGLGFPVWMAPFFLALHVTVCDLAQGCIGFISQAISLLFRPA